MGLELIDIADSAIDISDGLIQDLNLICKSSDVGAKVYLSMIPTSVEDKTLELINSGDDYQICFTASEINSTKIKHISERLGVPITEIGKITNSKELILLDYEGNKMELDQVTATLIYESKIPYLGFQICLGLSPVAPGTVGSIFAIAIYYFFLFWKYRRMV